MFVSSKSPAPSKIVPLSDHLGRAWRESGRPREEMPGSGPAWARIRSMRGAGYYRDKLARELGGQVDVVTPQGQIDLLTGSELIAVKSGRNWMCGLDQLQVNSPAYPGRRKRIHLFGPLPLPLAEIAGQCRNCDVRLTWEA